MTTPAGSKAGQSGGEEGLARGKVSPGVVVAVLLVAAAVCAPLAFVVPVLLTFSLIPPPQLAETCIDGVSLGGGSAAATVPAGDDPDGSSDPGRPVGDLTPKQMGTARTIYGTTVGAGRSLAWSSAKTDRAVLVALMTAKQESQLGEASGIERPNRDGDAGVFQQRQLPGWYGSLEQVTQVAYAARVFLRGKVVTAADVAAARRAGNAPAGPAGYTIPGLQQVRGWESLPLTVAAQRVQRSAFPDAYAQHERTARGLLAAFKADPGADVPPDDGEPAPCGPTDAMSCPPTGLGIEPGLNPDAQRVLRCVRQGWPQIRSFIGRAERPDNPTSDHPSGNAVDVMIPDNSSAAGAALGDAISAWLVAHRQQLGVKYVIWNQRIWSVDQQADGWRDYCSTGVSCGDDSSSHRDHVHVSTYGDSAGPAAGGTSSDGQPVLPVATFTLTARFGQCSSLWASCHTGLDFSAATGTPIRAVLGGKVVSTGWNSAYGWLTKIEAKPGLQFWYAHQSSQRVQAGDTVETGQVIGAVGATGNTTGPHLHLEVRVDGRATDPEAWLRQRGLLDGRR